MARRMIKRRSGIILALICEDLDFGNALHDDRTETRDRALSDASPLCAPVLPSVLTLFPFLITISNTSSATRRSALRGLRCLFASQGITMPSSSGLPIPHSVHLLSPTYILTTRSSLTSLLLSLCWSLLVILLYSTAILPTDGPCWQQKAAERTLGGLASVTGLLLAFRSNSATSRWDGASRCWASIQAAERNLLRLLGVGLYHDLQSGQQQLNGGGDDRVEELGGAAAAEDEEEMAQLEAYIDDFLRLLPSFALAVLVQLEAGPLGGRRSNSSSRPPAWLPSSRDTADVQASKQALQSLLPASLRRSLDFSSSSSSRPSKRRQSSSSSSLSTRTTSSATVKNEADREVKLSQNIDAPPDLLLRAQPFLDPLTGHVVPRNLPVDILRELQVGLVRFHQGVSARHGSRRRGGGGHHREIKLSGPLYAHSIGLLNTLTSQLTELERLRDTPIPALLSSHLHLLLNLQLCLTPLALAKAHVPLGWVWLPCLVLAMGSCGLHAVSEGLSLPFGVGGGGRGREKEKLPMRRLVGEVVGEWREVLGRLREDMMGEGEGGADDEGSEKEADEAMVANRVAASKSATTSSSRPPQQQPYDSLRHRRRSPRGHGHGHDTHGTNRSSSSKERRYPRPRVVVEEDGDLDLHGLADELADVDALAAADRIAAAYAGGGD